jgi:hypothetical protein
MRVKVMVWAGFLIFACAGSARAQWIPVVAKARETHETWKNSKLEKVDTKEGVFYRASDGSTLRYWVQVNGDESRGGAGEMTDTNNLVHYSLNVRTKDAHEVDRLQEKLKPGDVVPTSMKESLGDQVVDTFPCRRVPAFVQWPDGRREPIGEDCVSSEYALVLRTDHKATQGGLTHHVVYELYALKAGAEPDPKLFDLQKSGLTFSGR